MTHFELNTVFLNCQESVIRINNITTKRVALKKYHFFSCKGRIRSNIYIHFIHILSEEMVFVFGDVFVLYGFMDI